MASPMTMQNVDVGLLFAEGTATTAGTTLPLDSARSGSVMHDRFDPALRWYVPTFAVADGADSPFAFAATQAGVTGEGDPFDTAVLTLDLRISEPADLAPARAAEPASTFRQINIDTLSATLTLVSVGADGTPAALPYPARISQIDAGTARVTVDLQGPAVIVAFQNLRESAGAALNVSLSYRAWRQIQWLRFPTGPIGPRPFPWPVEVAVRQPPVFRPPVKVTIQPPPPPPVDVPVEVHPPPFDLTEKNPPPAGVTIARPAVGAILSTPGLRAPANAVPARAAEEPASDLPPGWLRDLRNFQPPIVTDPPPEPVVSFVEVTDVEATTVPLGSSFAGDPFRSRYTITASGMTRAIVDVGDLRNFAAPRSEYRELTSLGPVPDRYPSLRSLYLGQVSGTVVAIPARYGIVRSSSGCLAQCDAIVDDSPNSLTGSRFEFMFTVAPVVDPLDLARLRADLATSPEAQGRALQVALPSGLDPRTAPTFSGPTAAEASVGDGPAPHTLVVAVSIKDEAASPAITGVNLFLHQLAAAVTPMTGQVAIRLDDSFPAPVTTSIVLGLGTTADSDDLSVTIDPAAGAVSVANAGPLALRLTGLVSSGTQGIAETAADIALAVGGKTQLGLPAGAATVAVQRHLDLPDPMPQHSLFDYVHLEVQTIQSVQYPLGFNATAVNFAAASIAQIDLTLTLDDLPALAVPALTLTAPHRVDSVHVTVPIGAVVVGLSATVTITVTTADGSVRHFELHHDFLTDPIAVLTPADLAP